MTWKCSFLTLVGFRRDSRESMGALHRLHAFNAKHEAVAADDLDATSGRQRSIRTREPDFALDSYAPFAVLPGHGLRFRADQRLAAGHHRPPARAQQRSQHE